MTSSHPQVQQGKQIPVSPFLVPKGQKLSQVQLEYIKNELLHFKHLYDY